VSDDHAQYSPSRLERILLCPGSVPLTEALLTNAEIVEGAPSVYALKGTELHDHTYKMCTTTGHRLDTLDANDKGLVRECVEYKDTLVKSKGHSVGLVFEKKVSLASWGIPEVYGTADLIVFDSQAAHVDVVDWKFGSGVMVHAENNPQLLAYAAGAVTWPTSYKTVTVHVFQPPIDHLSTWTFEVDFLYRWVHETLAKGIAESRQPDANIHPGVEQCRWCPAVNHCDMRFIHVQRSAEELFQAQALLPSKITPEAIKDILEKAPLVEQAIKDLKLFVTNEIQRGRPFPGYKLVAGRSNRSWVSEQDALKWLRDKTPIDDLFVSKFVSPAQAEKLYSKLKRDKGFQALYEKKEGKPTLVPEKDPRPALQSASAAIDVFSKYADAPDKLE
jgi:hypothetical protein